MKTNIITSGTYWNELLNKIFTTKKMETKKKMKVENNTLLVLPDGRLITGEHIMRALELEKRLLAFAGDDEDG